MFYQLLSIPFLIQIRNWLIPHADNDPEGGIAGTPFPLSAFISNPLEATVWTSE